MYMYLEIPYIDPSYVIGIIIHDGKANGKQLLFLLCFVSCSLRLLETRPLLFTWLAFELEELRSRLVVWMKMTIQRAHSLSKKIKNSN